jgi:hypothetical protein
VPRCARARTAAAALCPCRASRRCAHALAAPLGVARVHALTHPPPMSGPRAHLPTPRASWPLSPPRRSPAANARAPVRAPRDARRPPCRSPPAARQRPSPVPLASAPGPAHARQAQLPRALAAPPVAWLHSAAASLAEPHRPRAATPQRPASPPSLPDRAQRPDLPRAPA